MYKRAAQGWLKHLDFILLDVLMLHVAFCIAYVIRQGYLWPYTRYSYLSLAVAMTVFDVLVSILFSTMHNVVKRGRLRELRDTIRHSALTFGLTAVYMFILQLGDAYSRTVLLLSFALHVLFSYAARLLWKRLLKRRTRLLKKSTLLLVCREEDAPELVGRLSAMTTEAYHVCGLVLIDRDAAGEICQGLKVVANMEDAAHYVCREWIDGVFVNGDISSPAVEELIAHCREMAVPVHLRLPVLDGRGGKRFVEKVGGCTVLTSTINYATPMQVFLKRLLDIIGGLVGSLIAVIIIAIVGPKIKKASPGPVLFKQERVGLGGKRFRMIKIRSMYMDAEERKKELMAQNRVADGMMFKLDFDPRIIGNEILPDGTRKTGIGEFIRSTSLDEFPQFFNILKGDMSLVGTRPPTVDEWEKYEYHHRARLSAKPGLTGLWQVSGRSEITDFEEVVRLDTEYITGWSLSLDIKILFKTIGAVFGHKGAM